MLSLPSSEKLDYLGDDNVDWEDVHATPETNKHSHSAEEEMHVGPKAFHPSFDDD